MKVAFRSAKVAFFRSFAERKSVIISLFAVLLFTANANAAQPLPNIVVILADDFGYGSANCYGADTRHIRTPNIDRLAAEGMKFTDANTPGSVCSPTRYALRTDGDNKVAGQQTENETAPMGRAWSLKSFVTDRRVDRVTCG